jgi:hypothetical protein
MTTTEIAHAITDIRHLAEELCSLIYDIDNDDVQQARSHLQDALIFINRADETL